jgi:hypothetical protein
MHERMHHSPEVKHTSGEARLLKSSSIFRVGRISTWSCSRSYTARRNPPGSDTQRRYALPDVRQMRIDV